MRTIQQQSNAIQIIGPTTGHFVKSIAYCDTEDTAVALTNAMRLVDKVANLNPNAGEIGPGMLAQLVTMAKQIKEQL